MPFTRELQQVIDDIYIVMRYNNIVQILNMFKIKNKNNKDFWLTQIKQFDHQRRVHNADFQKLLSIKLYLYLITCLTL